MNSGTIGSMFIGSLILLAILNLNSRIMSSSGETTMDQITKQNLTDVSEIIGNDFRKIGYKTTNNQIISWDSTEITFRTDLNNDGEIDTVGWKFDKTMPITSTNNPNDYSLVRTVNGVSTAINKGVTDLEITLYDTSGNETSVLNDAKSIGVYIECQGASAINNQYAISTWQKIFVPFNI